MRTEQKSFASGELTPELSGHVDSRENQTGLALCENFLTLPHGPAMFRPGLSLNQSFGGTHAPRLIPFLPDADSAYLVAIVEGGAYVLSREGTLLAPEVVLTAQFKLDFALGQFRVPIAATQPTDFIWVKTGPDFLQGQWFLVEDLLASDATYNYYKLYVAGYGPVDANFDISDSTNANSGVGFQNAVKFALPYLEADLKLIHYSQSFDVLTLACPGYALRTVRNTAGVWSVQVEDIGSTAWANSSPGMGATSTGTTPATQFYILTHVHDIAGEANEQKVNQGYISIDPNDSTPFVNSFNPAAAGDRVRVYWYRSGVWGYGGEYPKSASNIPVSVPGLADITHAGPPSGRFTTPELGGLFDPRAVGYHEQRKWFGGTTLRPQTLTATVTGSENQTGYRSPVSANDALEFILATLRRNTIEHLISLSSLIVLTQSAIFTVSGQGGIASDNVDIKTQSYIGANFVTPAVVGNTLLYAASRGGHIQKVDYSNERGGNVVADVSVLAAHMFEGRTVRDMALQVTPYPILWVVLDNFTVLSMTFSVELGVVAWHRHVIDGDVYHVAVLPGPIEDEVYFSVRRVGAEVRVAYSIERMESILETDRALSVRLDRAKIYDGGLVSTIYGLWYLEGLIVKVVGDGSYLGQYEVINGRIALPGNVNRAIIGLPYVGRLKTLPLVINAKGFGANGQGYLKNVNTVILRLKDTASVKAGPSWEDLRELQPEYDNTDIGAPPLLQSGEREIAVDPDWQGQAHIYLVVDEPFPAMVVSMAYDLEVTTR